MPPRGKVTICRRSFVLAAARRPARLAMAGDNHLTKWADKPMTNVSGRGLLVGNRRKENKQQCQEWKHYQRHFKSTVITLEKIVVHAAVPEYARSFACRQEIVNEIAGRLWKVPSAPNQWRCKSLPGMQKGQHKLAFLNW